jgi:hypothetical protein
MGAVVKTCCECWHNVLVKTGVVKLLDKVEAQVEHVVWDKVRAGIVLAGHDSRSAAAEPPACRREISSARKRWTYG